jgi:hypothetical protein
VSETVLEGGDLNHVVKVGDTVRRPQGEWSPAVHALLPHFEAVGFDGAPRFLGVDEQGREILSFVEGHAGLAPLPAEDEVLVGLTAADEGQPGWREMWDRGDGERALANIRLLEDLRPELEAALT